MDRAEAAVGGHEGAQTQRDEEERRAVLAQLSHLDELSPADEEEIGRFRSFATASAPVRGTTGLGRMVGHLMPAHRRAS